MADPADGEAATAARAGEKPLKGKAADQPGIKRAGGTKQQRTPLTPNETTPQADWASMFSGGLRASEDWPTPPLTQDHPETPVPQRPVDTADLQDAELKNAEPKNAEPKPLTAPDGAGEPAAPSADPAWTAAERIAASIEARLSETWLEVLTRHTDGDRGLAGRVYQAREEMGAIVTRVGDSFVVNRSDGTGPGAESLVASGVITRELLQRTPDALQRLEAVTATGPAARTVVRALASLIPSGSRVFVGPLMVLPSGCVAVKGPLDADFVTGVRPGAVAEDMAAAGQVGALIANPETRFQAAVRLVVTGRSLAPGKVSLH
ncbi:hypothetical protein [Actinomadura chokoriensis]|uniref:hypothetical protein n=1 Tax=Actinomadura chokoriensis TaxID=454156 RepID=UPI0031F9E9DA